MFYIDILIDGTPATTSREADEMINLFAGAVNLPVFIDEITATTGMNVKLKFLPPSGPSLSLHFSRLLSHFSSSR